MQIHINEIAARNALVLCMGLLPRGRLEAKKEWVALNPTRDDRGLGSFKICVSGHKAGWWTDFKTGDKGKNMITLYCYIKRLDPTNKTDYRKAALEISELLGCGE